MPAWKRTFADREYTARDRRFHIDVGVHRAFGLEVPDGGESIHERRPHCGSRTDGAVRSTLLQYLLVVVRARDVTLEQDVGVVVDEPGKKRCGAQVDRLRTAGDPGRDFGLAANSDDSIALHDHCEVIPRDVGLSVDQMRGEDHICARRCLTGNLCRRRQWKPERECKQSSVHVMNDVKKPATMRNGERKWCDFGRVQCKSTGLYAIDYCEICIRL